MTTLNAVPARLIACPSCSNLVKPVYRTMRLGTTGKQTVVLACPDCGRRVA